MRRATRKIGFWVFVAMVAWYAIGNAALGALSKHYVEIARQAHKDAQSFPMDAVKTVHIDQANRQGFQSLNIIFDANSTLAVVSNKNLTVKVEGHAADGALTIHVSGIANRQDGYSNFPIELHVPASVQSFDVDYVGEISIAGRLPDLQPMVTMNLASCGSVLDVGDFSVGHFQLNVACESDSVKHPANTVGSSGFTPYAHSRSQPQVNFLKNARINQLDVRMQVGNLIFHSERIPDAVRLELGKATDLDAKLPFLQVAKLFELD